MTDVKTDPKAVDPKSTEDRTPERRDDTKVGLYKVTAPYVTLKSKSEQGEVVLGYYAGAVLPETVDLEDLARHIRKGMVEKLEGVEAKAIEQQRAEAKKAQEAAPEDKEGAEAVRNAETARKAAEEAEAKEDAEAKKEGRTRVKAADSPRSTSTAAKG